MVGSGSNNDRIATDRGGVVENTHLVHAAVVDADGRLLFAVGNPSRMTLARSAAKPAQALAVLETGAFEKYGFDDADLALTCSSHSSEQSHIDRARAMLAKIDADASEEALQCGGHPSISPAVNHSWIKADFSPTALCNNCSAKHVAMLGGARALGASSEGYHELQHPMQQRVKQTVEELCRLQEHEVKWGIDGCNAPAPALPLKGLAEMYATLADAASIPREPAASPPRTRQLARIFHAMAQHPELIAGEDRFCTDLARTFEGQLIGKLGADGCYGVAVRASEQTRALGSDGAIGIAVKIEDGDAAGDILYAAVMEILRQLELGTPDMRWKLEKIPPDPAGQHHGCCYG